MIRVRAPRTDSILLEDDLTLVREGLAALCRGKSRYRVVAPCSEGATALRLIELDRPYLDLNLPDLYALDIVGKLRRDAHCGPVNARGDCETVIKALRFGVNAFLLKSHPDHHLLEAFEQIFDGGTYISPSLEVDKISSSVQKSASEDPLDTLAGREYQIFCLLVEGPCAKDIATRIDVSPRRSIHTIPI